MGFSNLREFNLGLDRFAKKIESRGLQFQKKVAFMLLGAFVPLEGGGMGLVSGVLTLTPVDTGRAVGNWQLSIAAPTSNVIQGNFGREGGGEANRGPAKAKAERAARAAIAGLRYGQTIWLVNNLPYIRVLNDGSGNRRAHHMLERAIANTRASLRRGA